MIYLVYCPALLGDDLSGLLPRFTRGWFIWSTAPLY